MCLSLGLEGSQSRANHLHTAGCCLQAVEGKVMSKTVHIRNWKVENRTVCGLRLSNRIVTRNLAEVTCDVCSLRIIREGQSRGLKAEDCMNWDLSRLEAYQ